jgi:hypothetical protein
LYFSLDITYAYSIVIMLYQHILKTTKEQYKNNVILEKIRSSEY